MTIKTPKDFAALKHKICSVKQPDKNDSWRAIRYRILCLWNPKLGWRSGHPADTLIKTTVTWPLLPPTFSVDSGGIPAWQKEINFQWWGFRERFQQLYLSLWGIRLLSTPWLHPSDVAPLCQQFPTPGHWIHTLTETVYSTSTCLTHHQLSPPKAQLETCDLVPATLSPTVNLFLWSLRPLTSKKPSRNFFCLKLNRHIYPDEFSFYLPLDKNSLTRAELRVKSEERTCHTSQLPMKHKASAYKEGKETSELPNLSRAWPYLLSAGGRSIFYSP